MIIITTDTAQSSDFLFACWFVSSCVRPDPYLCLCRGSRLSCTVLEPLEKAVWLPSGGAPDEVHNKPGRFRKVYGAKMSNDWHAGGRQPLPFFTASLFSFLHQNKELQKVYIYFPLFCSFGVFRIFQCSVGLVYVYNVDIVGSDPSSAAVSVATVGGIGPRASV